MQRDHQPCQGACEVMWRQMFDLLWTRTLSYVCPTASLNLQLEQISPHLFILGMKQIGTTLSETNKILNCYRNNTLL